jgi:hypothetical protein
VSCLAWVQELQGAGVRLIWFTGSIARAREVFLERGGIAVENFDFQVRTIQQAGLPGTLECVTIEALSDSGVFLNPCEVQQQVFA